MALAMEPHSGVGDRGKRFFQGVTALGIGGLATAFTYHAIVTHSQLLQEEIDNNYCINASSIPFKCIASLTLSTLSAFGSVYLACHAGGCAQDNSEHEE